MTTDLEPTADSDPTDLNLTPASPKGLARLLPRRPVTIAISAGVLGVLCGTGAGVGFAQIGGPSSGPTSSPAALTLPATLSGGFKRNTTVDTQIKTALASARTTLGAGTDMALYASGATQVLVEASRIGGAATLNAGMTYAKVGDAICASTSTSSGSEAICSRGNATLTVKVTAADQATAAKYVDEVYQAVA
jgi:hypothetical protein